MPTNNTTASALVTLTEAGQTLGVSPRTIRRRIADGTLRGYRIGPRLIRVDLAEAKDLLHPIPTTEPTP